MIKKKSVAISITLLLIAIVLCVSSIFAWFTSNSTINNITISVGEMKIETGKLYLARDFNRDGIPDMNDDKQITFDEVTVADGSEAKNSSFSLPDNVLPGDEFYYKLEVKNIGAFAGTLSATYTEIVGGLPVASGEDSFILTGFKGEGGSDNITLELDSTVNVYFTIKFSHATNSKPSDVKSIIRTLNVIITQPETTV